MTGFFTTRIASQKSGSEPCDKSTTMPSRSISSSTRRPNGVSPTRSPASLEEPPIGLEIDQVRVM